MSLSLCAECLTRLRIPAKNPSLLPSRPFTTTPPKSGSVSHRKIRNNGKAKFREATNKEMKKKPRVVPKLPLVGERKALRKRIVLSNTNALEVVGMQDLSVENMGKEGMVGQVVGLEGGLLDQLRQVRAFKPTQNWKMFRRPGVLVRRESVELGGLVREVGEDGGGRTVRRIVVGERSTGKSLMLLQAMSMAFMNRWIVINVPEGQEYTIAHSAYGPMKNHPADKVPSKPRAAQTPTVRAEASQQIIYNQPKLTAELLQRLSRSNEKVLKTLPLSHTHGFDGPPPKDLHSLALIGAENPKLSWPIWQALWKELTSPSQHKRPPVLIALDGIDHWMTLSKYRSADFNPIHAHHLAPIRHFLEILFNKHGAGNWANGGMILAATTGSNAPSVPTFDLLLTQLEAQNKGLKMGDEAFPMPQPYKIVDQQVLGLLDGSNGLDVQRLKGLERDVEARGLLEYFARSGVMREVISHTTVSEKWSLAGGGVVGEMARFGQRLRV